MGPTKRQCSEVRKIIEENENGQVINNIIPIKKEYPLVSHSGVLVKSLELNCFMVWLHLNGNKLSDPCTATNDFEEANVLLINHLEKMSSKSDILEYVEGDILSEIVDAIVNSGNEDLKHIYGLAKAILDACGSSIQSESTRYVEKNGKVKPGNAVCLGAGMLPVKHVIHAVAPRWILGVKNESTILYNAFLNICKCADKHNLSSITIPALGTGIFNVPVDICAQECFNALCDFCESMHSSSLSDVRLVLQPASIPSFKNISNVFLVHIYP